MSHLLIIACSATKRPDAGVMQAIFRYDGPAFRTLRKALLTRADNTQLDVRIVSAEHGLLTPVQDIALYDRRMNARRARELAPAIAGDLDTYLSLYPPATVFVCGGKHYRAALAGSEALRTLDGRGQVQWSQGGIGKQLNQLYCWLWNLPGAKEVIR